MSDLISRKALCEFCLNTKDRMIDANDIMRFPSAESERKKGKWIFVDSGTVNGRCSVCGYESHLYENDVYGEHYCPYCGADLG